MQKFNGVRVFSATMHMDRAVLGEKVTEWLAAHPTYEIADMIVTQSSDHAFHCITITAWYLDPMVAQRKYPEGSGVVSGIVDGKTTTIVATREQEREILKATRPVSIGGRVVSSNAATRKRP